MAKAVIQTGGKQYFVGVGDELLVEKLEGKKHTFPVAAVVDDDRVAVGAGSVEAETIGEAKGSKLVIFKMKPKKRSRTKTGHRQAASRIRITKVTKR